MAKRTKRGAAGIVEQSGPEMHMASHLVSLILVSARFAWHLVWDVGTLSNTLSGCATQDPRVVPQRLVLSTPLTFFVWLRARVRPSVVHVGI